MSGAEGRRHPLLYRDWFAKPVHRCGDFADEPLPCGKKFCPIILGAASLFVCADVQQRVDAFGEAVAQLFRPRPVRVDVRIVRRLDGLADDTVLPGSPFADQEEPVLIVDIGIERAHLGHRDGHRPATDERFLLMTDRTIRVTYDGIIRKAGQPEPDSGIPAQQSCRPSQIERVRHNYVIVQEHDSLPTGQQRENQRQVSFVADVRVASELCFGQHLVSSERRQDSGRNAVDIDGDQVDAVPHRQRCHLGDGRLLAAQHQEHTLVLAGKRDGRRERTTPPRGGHDDGVHGVRPNLGARELDQLVAMRAALLGHRSHTARHSSTGSSQSRPPAIHAGGSPPRSSVA
jgi:hypothetical protein